MRLFIDECLSPTLARRLNESGVHEAVHPIDIGRRGERDDTVLERCLAEFVEVVQELQQQLLVTAEAEAQPAPQLQVLAQCGVQIGGLPMGAGGGAAPQLTTDPTERLRRAKEMLDSGLITDTEYESIKARVVDTL